MTLESVVELENGKMVMVSEFLTKTIRTLITRLTRKMAINCRSWEVVLADEEHQ